MHWVTDLQVWLALLTLTAMEIVLGIDNIIFISILTGKLPRHSQRRARVLGLGMAMLTRIALLLSITWIMRLTRPFFTVIGHSFSGRDLILLVGGFFLLAKSVHEIHEKIEGPPEHLPRRRGANSFGGVILQVALLDVVFSIDSVVTAVGMTNRVPVMIAAIVIAVGVMMFASGGISRIVDRHPTIKILALSFLLLIGVTLVADGLGQHISKGYIYFAMAFAFFVEMLNLRVRKRAMPENQAG